MINLVKSMKIMVVVIIVFFICGCSPVPIEITESVQPNATATPNWIPRPKLDLKYFQGVGISPFIDDLQTSIDAAKQRAIFDLSSQIVTSVSGSVMDSVWEGMGISGQFIKQVIETSVKQHQLPNIEVVDTWINPHGRDVYIYVRLEKKSYEEYQNHQREIALNHSTRFLSDGDLENQKNNFSLALQYYLTSFYYSRFLLGEFNEVEYPLYSGERINIDTRISQSIHNLLNKISVNAINVPKYIKAYSNENTSLSIQVNVKTPGRPKKPLTYFPILYQVNNNSMRIQPIVLTNNTGISTAYFSVENPLKDGGIITVRLALDSIYIDKEKLDVDLPVSYSNVFISPFMQIEIPIVPTSVYLISEETIDGITVMESEKFVTKALLKHFSTRGGFVFVENEQEADFVIKLSADCQFQTEENKFHIFMTYMSIDIFKNENSKKKVFSKVFDPVEGFGNYRRQGGIETLEKAGILMRTKYAPEIVEFVTGIE